MDDKRELSFESSIGGTLRPRRSNCSYCVVCSKQVDLFTFEHAAELFHTDLQDIEFLAKQGDIHQLHNRKGQIMVCSPSLFECFEKRRTRLLDSGIIREIAAKGSA